jgi:integrase
MARFVPLLVVPDAPTSPELRRYLAVSLRPGAEPDQRWERWLDRWCYRLGQLDRSILGEVDRQLGFGLNGQLLAQNTARRYRNSARSCIRRAVELDLLDRDPWPPVARGAKNRKIRRTAKAIDTKRLPDPATMRRALAAIITHQPASRRYHVMTSIMAYAGLRPSEVVMLRPRALVLPDTGWGSIEVVEADISFDEPGDPKTGDRSVPIPEHLVETLQSWLDQHGFGDDELIFRTRNGNRPSSSNWLRAWHRALRSIGHERLRLYDCRHTAATTWLAAGVPLGETARRMGHSVETLVQTYVGALKGDEVASNRLIDDHQNRSLGLDR